MLATLIRFGGVGGLATLVHVLVALTAEHSLSLSAQQANLVGFLVSGWVSYVGYAHVSFRSGRGS
jgi:putative flippase GtrA